jgi:type I restriction enzyme S subunit
MSRWPEVRFGEFLKPNKRPYLLGETEDADLVGMQLYGQGPFHRERKPALQIKKKSHFVIKANDVIYNKLFAWKGTFGIVPPVLDGMFVSDKFPTYEADLSRIDLRYLRWYFQHPPLWDQARDYSKGAAALSKLTLNPPDFPKLTIPLPPLAEQRRLVERIDGLSAKINEAKQLRTEAAKEAVALVNSTRRKLIGNVPQSDWVPLSYYVERIENGWSPVCENRPVTDDEWGVLKVGAVSFGIFDPSENKALPFGVSPRPEYEVRSGDFIMSRANTYELVGACAPVESTPPRLMLSDKHFRFIFRNEAKIDRIYLDHVLKSPALREQIVKGASGTSPTMKNISKDKVLALRLPKHTASEQVRLAEMLSTVQKRLNVVLTEHRNTQEELDAMLPAILDRAFNGGL